MTTTLVQSSAGVDLTVRLVRKGGHYGQNFVLEHQDDDPLVEFYDRRHAHTVHGQFVSRCALSTILACDGGISLDSSGEFDISAATLGAVKLFLEKEMKC